MDEKTRENLGLETVNSESAVGGGSAPTSSLPTVAISVRSDAVNANEIADFLRSCNPPIVVRIADNCVLIDLRTVAPAEEEHLEKALCALTA